jgi:hypothetical protein
MLADQFEEAVDLITIRGALCLITAQTHCQVARTAMESLVPMITVLAAARPAAFYLRRMVADVLGERVGLNETQARAAVSLATAVVRCAYPCPVEAAGVLEQVIDGAVTIRSELDRAHALIGIFGALREGPTAWQCSLEGALSTALRRAQFSDTGLMRSVLDAEVRAMCAAGNLEAAERLARQASDAPLMGSLLEQVTAHRDRLALGDLSPFERAFVGIGNGDLAYAVLHSVNVDNESEQVLKQLGNTVVFEELAIERERLLSVFLPQFAAPLRTLHGTSAIGRVIRNIEHLEKAFVEAAHIVGQDGRGAN